MRPRLADSRIGIFLTDMSRINGKKDKIEDFSVINRWNIQPKDLEAWKRGELVEPVKPIVFYLDDAFPALWREPIRRGVLRWNKAFEKIGFKNVMHIEDFPKDDPEFDPDNLKYSCIRYVPAAVANAMGPSWVDPRSGEIINASVLMYNDVVKLAANWRFVQTAQVDERVRGKELPDDVFQESLEYILAHEVGHCLGLMHNMAASSAFPVDSLRSASFTQQHGTTPSIMDYARFNYVAQPGDKGVKLTPPDLGPYDDYVIKYAYTPLPDKKDMFDEEKTIRGWIDEKVGDPIYRPPAGDRPLRPHRHRGGPRRRPHQGRRLRHRQPQIRPLAHGGVDHRRGGPRPENPHGALRGRGRTVRALRERRDAQRGRHLPHGRE
jgi:hypothetical protein